MRICSFSACAAVSVSVDSRWAAELLVGAIPGLLLNVALPGITHIATVLSMA